MTYLQVSCLFDIGRQWSTATTLLTLQSGEEGICVAVIVNGKVHSFADHPNRNVLQLEFT